MHGVFTAEEMRRVDRRAVTQLGIPSSVLMEQAGRGAADLIARSLPVLGAPARSARVIVVCGKGGNGGDGFVVARWLRRAGARPEVLLAFPEREIGGDAAIKLRALRSARVRPVLLEDDRAAGAALARADLVVDALLGTGSRGAPEGRVARAIELINASGRPVVALDVPSGISADGERFAGPAVRATLTVTFAGWKLGLVQGPGVPLAGRVEVVSIGIPQAEVDRDARMFLLEAADVARHVPPRPRAAHKGTYGHLLLVAGSLGKTGAAVLAARAAMRTGVGLVTVATAASQQPVVAGHILEAMTEALPETGARSVGSDGLSMLRELAGRRDAVALGPGLGLAPDTQATARALVAELRVPAAVDADALTALAGHLALLREAAGPRCLTPHPGELGRMLGEGAAQVERDRVGVVRDFVMRHGVYLALKGARTVMGDPQGKVVINPTGNPGMASGGTGDVLTGMLGALLARGLAPDAALHTAVYLHGSAGDVAAERVGEEALIASDVIAALPEAFRRLGGASR